MPGSVIGMTTLRSELGEGVIWDHRNKRVYWVDILGKRLWKSDARLCRPESVSLPVHPTALALARQEDQVFVVTDAGLFLYDWAQKVQRLVVSIPLPDEHRPNDASVGADGCLWLGTMQRSPTERSGSVIRISPKARIDIVLHGIGIPNAFMWSRASTLLINDSLLGTLFELETGRQGAKIVRAVASWKLPEAGDGGAVDVNGNLWVAVWEGSRVDCLSPDGTFLKSITVPAERVTSCCFGGENLTTLYVSTARKQSNGGQLIALDAGVAGNHSGVFHCA